jgi:hypothetical protein
LNFRTVVSKKGGSYDFRVVLTRCYPLEAHLSRIAGEKGAEPELGRFSISESVRSYPYTPYIPFYKSKMDQTALPHPVLLENPSVRMAERERP